VVSIRLWEKAIYERAQARRVARVLYRFYLVWRDQNVPTAHGPRGPFHCGIADCEFCKTQKDVERVLREELGAD
jgi:hypothetical protein